MCSIRDEVHITKGNCIMTDTIINVSSLSFGYAGSDVLVLEDITFDIKKGEVALIIGASGNLDKENRRKIVELLQQIAHEQDRCVIVVTHSDYVKKKCDICYEMGDDDEE